MKLNLGCGRSPLEGWVNLDMAALPGVDVVVDLDATANGARLPFDDDSIDEIRGIDLIEHLREPLAVMAELWRVAKPGALCRFELPYGSSDDAWDDPTHRRPYFVGSWGYFGQPYYWRADYGYRGDWRVEQVALALWSVDGSQDDLMSEVMALRNVVARQAVVLSACKPSRPASRELIEQPPVVLTRWEG